jgi:hypothetical protein
MMRKLAILNCACRFILPLFALSTGCNSLPPSSVDAVRTESHLSRRGEVFLLRGWRGLWSQGIDALAGEVSAQGIDAHVYQETQADALAEMLLRESRASQHAEPLVLVGFSYGADGAIRIARKLRDGGVNVDLLVLLDPVTPAHVPPTVRRCRNFYQSNGVWDAFPWLRGVPVAGEGSASQDLVNVNIRERDDLLEPNTGHDTIAANPKLHRAIIQQIMEECPPRPVPTHQ